MRNKTIQNQLDTNLDELIPTIPRNLLTKKLISTQILGQIAKELDYDGLIVPIERNFDTDYYIVIFNFVIEKVVDNYYKIC